MWVSALIAAVIAFIKALLGGKPKDPEIVEAQNEAKIAEKQAEIVADRTRPDAASSLRDGKF